MLWDAVQPGGSAARTAAGGEPRCGEPAARRGLVAEDQGRCCQRRKRGAGGQSRALCCAEPLDKQLGFSVRLRFSVLVPCSVPRACCSGLLAAEELHELPGVLTLPASPQQDAGAASLAEQSDGSAPLAGLILSFRVLGFPAGMWHFWVVPGVPPGAMPLFCLPRHKSFTCFDQRVLRTPPEHQWDPGCVWCWVLALSRS